jgi:hypothetical protein
MKTRADVLLWAQRITAKKDPQPHQLLEIKPDAGIEEAQAAFHRIAKSAHPDLHRNSLDARELELLTTAYSRIAAAYHAFRGQRMTGKVPALRPPTVQSTPIAKPSAEPSERPASPPPAGANAAGAMTSKALVYYRKAELALRRGDLKGAVLQLKLAIAADPLSGFLRSALAEVEAEVGKNV